MTMSKFEIEVELLAVVVVEAADENSARTLAYTNLESRLKLAAEALGADEVKILDVVGSEPIHGEPNKADDAEPFYRPPRFRGQA
jgi:hypothetical protein